MWNVEWTVQLDIVEWPTGLGWDEQQYYMGLVAFRYSGQTVGHCLAPIFLLWKTVFLSFGQLLQFLLQNIYLGVVCMLPFAAFVCEGFSFIVFAISTRLSAMACQSLLLTIWRGAQRNVICHRFIPDEHVQAICSSLLVWSMIICFYLVCFLAKHFFKTNNQLDLL